ncbi:Hypothetical predicted protein [Lecanosticta acicola]|uniref:Uncharacterized protein n=1 Tax=Lecanosticta acicola TaxID=111012 RepID=A0AAI9EAA0_9PEZI|nr:Hypothetical predicted protein [Lecanosticta acicola]
MVEEQQQPPQRFNTRPESTIAQNFAADLDSMFGLSSGSDGVDTLHKTVEEKKQTVTSGEATLQELEAKLRETEERLAKVSRHNSPSRQANTAVPRAHPDNNRQAADGAARSSPLVQKPTYPVDRPPTAKDRPPTERADTRELMNSIPGGMPEETPNQTGGNEYVMVDRNAGTAQRGYG